MAVKIQFRRGTAAEWTSVNPTLAAGELGYEADTGQFKIGNGSTNWVGLAYGAVSEAYVNDAISNVVGLSPETLNTLEELATAIGNNSNFVQTVTDMVADAEANVVAYTDNAVAGLVNSAPQTLNTLSELSAALNNDENFYLTLQNSINGVNTYAVDYTDNAIIQVTDVFNTALTFYATTTQLTTAVGEHTQDTTNVHGISDTANLVYAQELTDAISTHSTETLNVHGIANTAALATLSDVTQSANTINNTISDHVALTLNVHGIADTSDLVTGTNIATVIAPTLASYATLESPEFTGTVVLPATTSIGSISGTEIGYLDNASSNIQDQLDAKLATASAASIYAPIANTSLTGNVSLPATTSIGNVSADEIGYLNNVSSAIQTQLDAKAPLADPTFTGTVSGITKTMVGLGSVDNTADADKPISTATQEALDLKANLAGATFSGDVTVTGDFTVTGTTTTVNTANFTTTDTLIYLGEGNEGNTADLGFVANFNDGTYQHTGLVRDSSAGTWKLFKGVTDEPTATVNFAQGSLDDLQANNVTVAGVVFTDGTQTKVGVPSISSFTYKTASYTLDSLALRDNIIEVANTSATTITIPAEATTNYPIGASIDIIQTSTGQVTIAGAAGVTVNATPGLKLRTQWSSATLLKRAADTWLVYGDLTA